MCRSSMREDGLDGFALFRGCLKDVESIGWFNGCSHRRRDRNGLRTSRANARIEFRFSSLSRSIVYQLLLLVVFSLRYFHFDYATLDLRTFLLLCHDRCRRRFLVYCFGRCLSSEIDHMLQLHAVLHRAFLQMRQVASLDIE